MGPSSLHTRACFKGEQANVVTFAVTILFLLNYCWLNVFWKSVEHCLLNSFNKNDMRWNTHTHIDQNLSSSQFLRQILIHTSRWNTMLACCMKTDAVRYQTPQKRVFPKFLFWLQIYIFTIFKLKRCSNPSVRGSLIPCSSRSGTTLSSHRNSVCVFLSFFCFWLVCLTVLLCFPPAL